VDLAKRREGARVVGIEPHGNQELRQRLRVAPLQEVDLAQRSVRLGAVGTNRDARLVGGDRGREIRLVDANARQPLIQRVAPQDGPRARLSAERVRGLGQARLPLEQLAKAVPGQARLRERRNRGPQFPLGLAWSPGLTQDERHREPRALVARAQLDSRAAVPAARRCDPRPPTRPARAAARRSRPHPRRRRLPSSAIAA
jgi:hypothetical protein